MTDITDARERLVDATLVEWVKRWWDVLFICLDERAKLKHSEIELKMLRMLRIEIMILINSYE